MRNNELVPEDECITAEERAHDDLNVFFSKPSWFTRPIRDDHMAVLCILKEFPRLRSTRFKARYAPDNNRILRVTPLRLLVEGQADLDIIRMTYELNPAVLSRDFDLIFIFRRACEYRAPAAVVEYLGLKFPKALSDSCYKHLALHCALRDTAGKGKSSLKTVQVLLNLCPKSVHYVNKEGDNALNLAIMNGYDLTVVELILNVMQQQSCDLSCFSIPRRWNYTLDVDGAQSINLVLSRQNNVRSKSPGSFECRPTEWTNAGFKLLMNILATFKSSLYSIKLDLPNDLPNIPKEDVEDGVRNVVDCDSRVQELEIVARSTPAELIDATFRGLESGLRTNQSLDRLQLQNMQSLDLKTISAFLASETAPREIRIIACHVHGTDQPTTLAIHQCHKIEHLELKNCHMESRLLSSFLDLVANMPQLRELYLISPSEFSEHGFGLDIALPVQPLVALMRHNTIQSLGIAAYTVRAKTLYESFFTNTSLQQYRYTNKKGCAPDRVQKNFSHHKQMLALAMECGNVTLVDPYIGDCINMPGGNTAPCATTGNTYGSSSSVILRRQNSSDTDGKIDYYKSLNRFGRITARNPTESMESVIKLLCTVNNPYACFPCLDPLRKHNLQHGLLRESLSIWSRSF